MRRFARLLLLWMIALALPFQAAYAVATPSCGFATQGHDFGVLQATPAGHHHDDADVDDEDSSSVQPALVGDHHDADHDEHHHHAHASSGKGSCSVCASCCSSAAPPPEIMAVAAQRIEVATVHSFVPAAHVSFLTDGPERPPRSILG